jgi:hypothetical protein
MIAELGDKNAKEDHDPTIVPVESSEATLL